MLFSAPLSLETEVDEELEVNGAKACKEEVMVFESMPVLYSRLICLLNFNLFKGFLAQLIYQDPQNRNKAA